MRQQGFTLIEVLIAVAISAIVAAASYSGIATVLNGSEQLRDAGDRTRDLNRAMGLLDRDLRQFVNRPVRDEFGDLQPALAGGPLAFFPLSLTREGWHNGLQQPRSDLQRVHYYLEEGALWRAYHLTLDRVVDVQPQRVRLLDGVDELELRFLGSVETLQVDRNMVIDTGPWERNWTSDPGGQSLPGPPAALELRLQLADLGELRRLYVLPTP
jgi:general secretion pathway protein J